MSVEYCNNCNKHIDSIQIIIVSILILMVNAFMKLAIVLISILIYVTLIELIGNKIKTPWIQAVLLILNALLVIYESYLINIFL